MKSYKRYLGEIGNFELRAIDPFQSNLLSDNFRFGDIQELESLKGFVLKELADALPGNVKLKLKKLREKNKTLKVFDSNYTKLYAKSENGLLKMSDLKKYFPHDELDKRQNIITTDYLKTFYQSVLDRQKSLLNLIEKVEDMLVSQKETLAEQATRR